MGYCLLTAVNAFRLCSLHWWCCVSWICALEVQENVLFEREANNWHHAVFHCKTGWEQLSLPHSLRPGCSLLQQPERRHPLRCTAAWILEHTSIDGGPDCCRFQLDNENYSSVALGNCTHFTVIWAEMAHYCLQWVWEENIMMYSNCVTSWKNERSIAFQDNSCRSLPVWCVIYRTQTTVIFFPLLFLLPFVSASVCRSISSVRRDVTTWRARSVTRTSVTVVESATDT